MDGALTGNCCGAQRSKERYGELDNWGTHHQRH